jgi:hypothetical protein
MTAIVMTQQKFAGHILDPDTRVIEYARGHSGFVSRCREMSRTDKSGHRIVVRCCADLAWKAYSDGLVSLAQRKNGPDDFSYLAIKVRK